MTCSGGDSAQGADETDRRDLELPAFAARTKERLAELLPSAATVANPLDYTAMIWGDRAALAELIRAVGEDPSIDQVLVFYDQPRGLTGAMEESWEVVRAGIIDGAQLSPVPTLVSSTLPELLDDAAAWQFVQEGVPATAGLRTGVACAAALAADHASPAQARRLREISGASRRAGRTGRGDHGSWLSEHQTKELLRGHGIAVVDGMLVHDGDGAAAAVTELGGRIAMKVSAASVQHKSELGAVELGIETGAAACAAFVRLAALAAECGPDGAVLCERMEGAQVELLVAAHTDGAVPAVIVGFGGIWTEILDDVAVIPLPADAARIELALRSLRGAKLLTGARGAPAADLRAAAELSARAGQLLLDQDLELLELNPVFVGAAGAGAIAVDATARRRGLRVPEPQPVPIETEATRCTT
jgi:acetyl-CoA synthetase